MHHALAVSPAPLHDAAMITGPQIRAARALLGWSARELAERSGVSYPTIQRAEQAADVPEMKTSNMQAVTEALEGAGVRFITTQAEAGAILVRRR